MTTVYSAEYCPDKDLNIHGDYDRLVEMVDERGRVTWWLKGDRKEKQIPFHRIPHVLETFFRKHAKQGGV